MLGRGANRTSGPAHWGADAAVARSAMAKLARSGNLTEQAETLVEEVKQTLAANGDLRRDMFWHGTAPELLPQRTPTVDEVVRTFSAFHNRRNPIEVFAPRIVEELLRQLGYGEYHHNKVKVTKFTWQALFGFKTNGYVKKVLYRLLPVPTNEGEHPPASSDQLTRADFDLALLNLDYLTPDFVITDFLTVRCRVLVAFKRVTDRHNFEKTLWNDPPRMRIDDCLYWTTKDGQEMIRQMKGQTQGFYNLGEPEPSSRNSTNSSTSSSDTSESGSASSEQRSSVKASLKTPPSSTQQLEDEEHEITMATQVISQQGSKSSAHSMQQDASSEVTDASSNTSAANTEPSLLVDELENEHELTEAKAADNMIHGSKSSDHSMEKDANSSEEAAASTNTSSSVNTEPSSPQQLVDEHAMMTKAERVSRLRAAAEDMIQIAAETPAATKAAHELLASFCHQHRRKVAPVRTLEVRNLDTETNREQNQKEKKRKVQEQNKEQNKRQLYS